MGLDDRKPSWQDTASRYGPGAALFFLGIACKCAWDHHVAHRVALPPAFQTQGAADLHTVLASEALDSMPPNVVASGKRKSPLPGGVQRPRAPGKGPADSFEDALQSLEMGGDDDAALEAMITEKRKTSKGAKTAQPSKKNQRTAEKPKKESGRKKSKASAEDALAKLEGRQPKKSSSTGALDPVAEPELTEEELIGRLKKLFPGLDDEEARPPLKAAKKKAGDAGGKKEEPASVDDGFHVEFQRRLTEERSREAQFNLSEIKKEFKKEYDSHHKNLLCSGCKLVTARLGTELETHSVREQENPALMLTAVRSAIESTCTSLRHLDVVPHEKGYKFEAGEAAAEEAGLRVGQKLCHSLLEESRFDILTTLMQKKVTTWHVSSSEENWERRICASTAKFCKRSETREDTDDEHLADL